MIQILSLKNGETRYLVRVFERSRTNRDLKVQLESRLAQTEVEAKKIEKELQRRAIESVKTREREGEKLVSIIDRYEIFLREESEGVSNHVAQDYIAMLRNYLKPLGNMPASTITPYHLRQILLDMDKNGKSLQLRQKLLSATNKLYGWAVDMGILPNTETSPAKTLKVKKPKERAQAGLTYTESCNFLAKAKELNHPWYPIWLVALHTGMRSGELFALKWTDVNFEYKEISVNKSWCRRSRSIKGTKNGKVRTVPMSNEVHEFLRDLKLSERTEEHVLPRLVGWDRNEQARVLKQFLLGIGIAPVRFHDLRATFATMLLRQGVAAATVMKMGGWQDLETLQIYLRMSAIETRGATDGLRFLVGESKEMGGAVP